MPNYDYRCKGCGEVMQAQRKIAERYEGPICGNAACESRGLQMEFVILGAPALKDYPGSHKDEYTKYGPRK